MSTDKESSTDKNTSTHKDSASVAARSASSSTVPVSAKIASVGGRLSAKVKMLGVTSVGRGGSARSRTRKKPDAD